MAVSPNTILLSPEVLGAVEADRLGGISRPVYGRAKLTDELGRLRRRARQFRRAIVCVRHDDRVVANPRTERLHAVVLAGCGMFTCLRGSVIANRS